MAMKAIDSRGVKIYDLCVGKTLPQWLSERNRRSLRKDIEYRRRIELVQDFYFNSSSQRIKVSNDGNYIFATGTYPPIVKCYDVRELSLKFERHLDAEVVQFQLLSDDYSKIVFLGNDRTLSFHAAFGFHHKLRIPKFGRDMSFNPGQCEVYISASSSEVYRVNLDLGRFMSPLETKSPSVNVLEYLPELQLLACGGEDSTVSCWDVRAKPSQSGLLNVLDESAEITALKHDKDNSLSLAVGTGDGRVALYDLRSSKPMVVKEHQHGFPITFIDFQTPGDLILTGDKKVIKVWDRHTGQPFTTIEAQADMNEVCLVKRKPQNSYDNVSFDTSGLLLASGEMERVMSFYVPELGPAPAWASFLDNLTEELEETNRKEEDLYENYKFVTREELKALGLWHLIGTPMLRAYMHGYFMDMRLYHQVKAVSEPQAFEQWRKSKIKEKIAAKNAQRIKPKKKTPKVNKELAQRQQSNPDLKDNRFSALFEDPDFQVDQESERFKQVYPSGYGKPSDNPGQDDDENEGSEDEYSDDNESDSKHNQSSKDLEEFQKTVVPEAETMGGVRPKLPKVKKKLKVQTFSDDATSSGIIPGKKKKKKSKREKEESMPVWKRIRDGEDNKDVSTKFLGAGNVEVTFTPKE
mmetsp:Transcript_2395/g.3326  ORF Transcript_2395/g.3326 Transcript_2395/m.3326 type:complete len:636 (+) Transcript_2395:214-2121(+)|eukprot:CAMPEP_0184017340 /NCGR_PEP_ID=MMETSP0954-20121128/7474_1 /TAXON_ID=627963 /ORGANISM="Aplanochytrium sp, Strain PBS07" /LENGTH=635 /DNA_ID=CAMNT_0026298549 /DNA_START=198 /DNA_END=2105 /DNA_ORIENTATION=+